MDTDRIAKRLLLDHVCKTCKFSFYLIPRPDGRITHRYLSGVATWMINEYRRDELYCDRRCDNFLDPVRESRFHMKGSIPPKKIPKEETCGKWEQ